MVTPRKPRNISANNKARGRKLQKKVESAVLTARPTLQPSDVVSCPMGSAGADLWLSAEAQRQFPFSVECKKRQRIGLVYDALIQARRDDFLTPLAVVEADRKRPLAVMYLDDFMHLIAKMP